MTKNKNNHIIVEPKKDFWSLEGVLVSGIKLSDKELREARESFSKNWPKASKTNKNFDGTSN